MSEISDLMITTTEQIVGFKIVKVIGAVFGVSVRSRSAAGNWMGNIRAMFGGSQTGYAKMIAQNRQDAIENMVQHAKDLGANAIIIMRFDSSQFDSGKGEAMNETTAYGTAVVIEPILEVTQENQKL